MKSLLKNVSIRGQLMISVLAAFLITVLVAAFLSAMVSRVMKQAGNSFMSNAELDVYLTNIEQIENALEAYMTYRTFESIDKYYHYEAAAETLSERFRTTPSSGGAEQKKFIIRQLSKSFFDLSNRAIAARRANDSLNAPLYFYRAEDCYSFLHDEIVSLSILFFKDNANFYTQTKTLTERTIRRTSICLTCILVCTALLLYLNIVRITRPLSEISGVAQKVAGHDFDVPLFNSSENNEIGNICRAFDEMIISIREYIDTIWEKARNENELREKEIEMRVLYTDAHLKALQDQIQPHFLFNTLNTGAQLAMIEGADKTCYFLEQVADFLRYNIQHPGSDATIGEELQNLDNYIYIMKTRFGERYKFIKKIDESALQIKMPNTILQPLVENCIKHGLDDVAENGRITISVEDKRLFILITISDNGKGFDPKVRNEILKQAKAGSSGMLIPDKGHVSAGMINVISRLQIYFKDASLFDITGNADGGTTFVIKIPAKYSEEKHV